MEVEVEVDVEGKQLHACTFPSSRLHVKLPPGQLPRPSPMLTIDVVGATSTKAFLFRDIAMLGS